MRVLQRAHPPRQRTQVWKHLFAGDKGLLCLCHVAQSPRRTPAPTARFPARRGKLFPREGVMLGTGSRPPSPRPEQPDTHPSTTPRCRAGSAVRRSSKSPRGAGDEAGPGGRPWRALLRRVPPAIAPRSPHIGRRRPHAVVSSCPPEPPPRNLFCPHGRAPLGRHPRRHREGARRLPGGCRGAPSRRAAAGRAAAGAASAATFTAPSRGERCAGWRRGADGEP